MYVILFKLAILSELRQEKRVLPSYSEMEMHMLFGQPIGAHGSFSQQSRFLWEMRLFSQLLEQTFV
jgi:hypothetical protein